MKCVAFLILWALHLSTAELITAASGTQYPIRNIWTCNQSSGNCRRSKSSDSPDSLDFHSHSLALCGLMCGQYRTLWPRPTGLTKLGSRLVAIDLDRVRCEHDQNSPEAEQFITQVCGIFIDKLRSETIECPDCIYNPSRSDVVIKLQVLQPDLTLNWTTDESYTLDLRTDDAGGKKLGNLITDASVSVHIKSATLFGLRHGLETLSQLVAHSVDAESRHMAVVLNSAKLSDVPAFAHRGLLLDIARNFLSVRDLKRTLDGMAATKLNVLHLHATDSQSFPLELPSEPLMASFGAYSRSNTFSDEDIKEIMAYGKLRGVRVLIEIDAPSHAGSGWQWGPEAGLGNLTVCGDQQPWRSFCIQPPCGQLNPANPNVFAVLRRIYRDVVGWMARGESLHMGGDEVFFPCWNSTEEVVHYMRSLGLGRGLPDFLRLWSQFQDAALRAWDSATESQRSDGVPLAKAILWSSHLTDPDTIAQYLPKERYIIQTWVPSTDDMPQRLLDQGYELIISTKNAWYFDHGFWGQTAYYTWATAYNNRIQRQPGVLGGEACVWSELIDGNSLDDRIWPRASAVAERLWSNPAASSAQSMTRMYRHREHLVRLGLGAGAVAPKWCVQNEGECR